MGSSDPRKMKVLPNNHKCCHFVNAMPKLKIMGNENSSRDDYGKTIDDIEKCFLHSSAN